MKYCLDITAMLLATIWLAGFFGAAMIGGIFDLVLLAAVVALILRYKLKSNSERERSVWIKKLDYDAED